MRRVSTLVVVAAVIALAAVLIFSSSRHSEFAFHIDPSIEVEERVPGLDGGPDRSVYSLVGPDGRRDDFVADEVVMRVDESDRLDAFLSKYEGTIVRDGTVIDMEGVFSTGLERVASQYVLIRLDPDMSELSTLSRNATVAGLVGDYKISSDKAARLLNLIISEANNGVLPNLMLRGDSEEHPTTSGSPEYIDAEKLPWMSGPALGIEVTRAWDYLRYHGVPPSPVGSLDGSVLGPSYRGGVVRANALDALGRLEEETGTHSVALGQLGPPELSKLLWEAELLRLGIGTVSAILAATPEEISDACARVLEDRPELVDTITSLGLPILSRDGRSIRRGPLIRIPEIPGQEDVDVESGDVDVWADKGWVDLRQSNARRWRERFRLMREARLGRAQPGSAGITGASYLPEELEIGTIAAWVIANEHGGSRIK